MKSKAIRTPLSPDSPDRDGSLTKNYQHNESYQQDMLSVNYKKDFDQLSSMSRSNLARAMLFGAQPLKTNNIKPLTRPTRVRNVNLDLDSPRMVKAMETLGLVKADLNNSKRLDDFAFDFTKSGDRLPVEGKIIELRFKHYQQKMMERINRVLDVRRRFIEKEQLKSGLH